jgi:uncharacterized membrane protein
MSRFRDLRTIAIAAPVLALVALLIPFNPIRVVVAAPLLFVGPGYAIVAAAFARRDLDWRFFGLLSVAMSVVVLVLGTLLLTLLPGGINAVSWAVLLVAVTLIACLVAARRRPAANQGPQWPRPEVSGRGVVLITAGAAFAAAAVIIAMATLPASKALGFTQLWIVPQGAAAARQFEVGVASDEQTRVNYVLEVELPNTAPTSEEFTLVPGAERLKTLDAGAVEPGVIRVRLKLRNDPETVYRRVSAVIPSPSGP